MVGTRIAASWACLAAALLLGGPAAAEIAEGGSAATTVPDLPNPPEIRSRRGVLDAVFVAEPGKVTVATDRITSNVYNDLYIPPTLRVRRGDTMLLRLVNKIGPADVEITEKQPTNIHFHGMDVSPLRPGDNVFVNISPGKSFQYRVDIPDDHPEGLHWYHSHLHEFVDPQILSGLSGMLIVDGGIESHYPELAGLRQRVMVLKDINLPGSSSPTRTVNNRRRSTPSACGPTVSRTSRTPTPKVISPTAVSPCRRTRGRTRSVRARISSLRVGRTPSARPRSKPRHSTSRSACATMVCRTSPTRPPHAIRSSILRGCVATSAPAAFPS